MKVKYEKGDYYKVVRKESDEYVSCIVDGKPFMLSYSLGKITWAPLGTVGILVFDSHKEAIRFIEYSLQGYNSYILRGKVVGPIKMFPLLYYASNLDNLLNCKSQSEIDCYCSYLSPPGTVAASGFLPEEVVNGK